MLPVCRSSSLCQWNVSNPGSVAGNRGGEKNVGESLRIGPTVYNGAVRDAQAWFQEKVGDLDGSCFEPEFDYWK